MATSRAAVDYASAGSLHQTDISHSVPRRPQITTQTLPIAPPPESEYSPEVPLRIFLIHSRPVPSSLPVISASVAPAEPLLALAQPCSLAQCLPGSRATVLGLDCNSDDACRLRALGLCEGTAVSVIDSRHAMVLDVRGTRLALGAALTSGITVQPMAVVARSAR